MQYNIEITRELEIKEKKAVKLLTPNHGTICAAIVRKYAPMCSLSSIKVLNENSRGIKEQLIKAIRWCGDQNIMLLNLSLGTIHKNDFETIKEAVDYAFQRKVIIIAACNNREILTCPAALANVIRN